MKWTFRQIPAHILSPPAELKEALGVTPQETLGSAEDLLVVLDSEATVREVQPDFPALARIACRGIIITARGERGDFVSRFFAPHLGVQEDPVTGSSHSVLVPYWAGRLGKNDLLCLPGLETGRRALLHSCGRAREDLGPGGSLYGRNDYSVKLS